MKISWKEAQNGVQMPTGLILWQPPGCCLGGAGYRFVEGGCNDYSWINIWALASQRPEFKSSADPLKLSVPQLHNGMMLPLHGGHEY